MSYFVGYVNGKIRTDLVLVSKCSTVSIEGEVAISDQLLCRRLQSMREEFGVLVNTICFRPEAS